MRHRVSHFWHRIRERAARRKRLVFWTLGGIAAIAAGSALFLAGLWVGLARPHRLTLTNVSSTDVPNSVGADFNLFWQAWDILRNNALKSNTVSDQDLVYGSIDGLLKSLNDPYSVFQKPTDATKFNQDVNGNFGGVGMRIDVKDKQLIVIQPLKGSPSDKAGIRAGDKILKIHETSTADMSVEHAVELIRGAVGTQIDVTILRDGWVTPKKIALTRDVIQVPTLDYSMKEGNIAYIQLYGFNLNAPQLFANAANQAISEGAKGMILDLRGNPGGFLEVAVNLAGWFVKNGDTVVSEEHRTGEKNIFTAYGNAIFHDMPLVVLVDSNSASASEILAGALRDDVGAVLVGDKTFGKGTVQELKQLTDGSQIKITVAHWLLPKGDLIDKTGIEPKYKVTVTDEDIKNQNDVQLKKALQVAEDLVAKKGT